MMALGDNVYINQRHRSTRRRTERPRQRRFRCLVNTERLISEYNTTFNTPSRYKDYMAWYVDIEITIYGIQMLCRACWHRHMQSSSHTSARIVHTYIGVHITPNVILNIGESINQTSAIIQHWLFSLIQSPFLPCTSKIYWYKPKLKHHWFKDEGRMQLARQEEGHP